MNAHFWKKFHLGMMLFWTVLVVPSILWWSESILFVIFVSLYANFIGHFSSWQAAHVEERMDEKNV